MSLSKDGRLLTTRPWPNTGLNVAVDAAPRRWTSTPSGSSEPNKISVRYAGICSSTLTKNPSLPTYGSNGSWPPAGRCASNQSHRQTAKPSTVNLPTRPHSLLPPTRRNSPAINLCMTRPRPRGFLEPDAWKAGTTGYVEFHITGSMGGSWKRSGTHGDGPEPPVGNPGTDGSRA